MKITDEQLYLASIFEEISPYFSFTKGISISMRMMWFSEKRIDEYKRILVQIRKSIEEKLDNNWFSVEQKMKLENIAWILKQINY